MDYTVRLAICDCTDPDCDVISCEDLVQFSKLRSIEEAAEYLEEDANDLQELANNLLQCFNCDSFDIRVGLFKVTFSKKQDELAAYAADAHNCVSHHHYDDDGHKRCVICDEIIDVHQDGTLW